MQEHYIPLGHKTDITLNTLSFSTYIKNIIEGKGNYKVSSCMFSGYTKLTVEKIYKFIIDNGGKVVFENSNLTDIINYLFSWKDSLTYCHLFFDRSSDDQYVDVNIYSDCDKLFIALKEFFSDVSIYKDNLGYVFSIVKGDQGQLQLSRLGVAGLSLIEDNYEDHIIKDYKYVVNDLSSQTPSGRICILEGCPGSGKSFLIRALLNEVEGAMFILVPPDLVSSLDGPDLLPVLLRHKELNEEHGPIIFILEDADHCLVPRQGDNMSSISSLLNLGDGILGSLLDVRIIATTNAKADKMDAAILRAGRLSKHIKVGELSTDKSNKIYSRLLGKESIMPLSKPIKSNKGSMGFNAREEITYTLAEIYQAARQAGWMPENKNTKKRKNKRFNQILNDIIYE